MRRIAACDFWASGTRMLRNDPTWGQRNYRKCNHQNKMTELREQAKRVSRAMEVDMLEMR
jgi:hypothetical protein